MLIRKLLLISLFTGMSILGVIAQIVTVHGTVTNSNGDPQDSVNILVTAFFADSTAIFESVYTGPDGTYEVDFSAPLNLWGAVEVSMVDCWGNVVSQFFTLQNGLTDIEANFVYCEQPPIDSCIVYIIEEWNPGANTILTAWVPVAPNGAEYQWSTGESTPGISPQQPGTYCVTVSFPFGCEAYDCYDYLGDTLNYCFTYISQTPNGDGTYNLEAISQGASPFTYIWNTGVSTYFLNNVGPGTYCVTVQDALGCVYETCTFIDDFDFCTVWISPEPNGEGITAYASGQPPISYIWNTGETTQTIYPNDIGTYCVTITDENQCSASSCYYNGPFKDSCYVYVAAIFLDSNTIALQAIGFPTTDSVFYVWNTGETTDIIYPIDPSLQYCVTMTDGNACVATACFESSNWCYAWVDIQYVDTTTAVLSVYNDPIFGWGGSNTATYLWSNGATTPIITVTESGNYCVTVTLGANCVTETCTWVDFDSLENSCSVWVVQYSDPVTNLWYAEALSWGFGTFTYLWNTGDTTPVIELDNPNEFVCVTATSSFGCVAEACVDTFFNQCKVYIDIVYLNDSLAILTAYAWNTPGQNGEFVWSDGQTGQTITVWVPGSYCVTVTGGGCVAEACVFVDTPNTPYCGVWISEEPAQSGILFTANAWGAGPFTYLWSNGATTESQIVDFGPTDLCVTIWDTTGCSSTACNYDTLNPENGFNFITGFVFADTLSSLRGQVYAYSISSNGGPFELVDSAQILQGFYKISNLKSGLYVVQAVLDPENGGAAEYLPTYHLSSASWETATPYAVPNMLPVTTDIWMIKIDSTNGIGVIGGVISDPNHIVAEQDAEVRGVSGLPGINVILKDANGNPINYTVSLADGSFRFINLPLGTYRISYDIPGVHSPDVWVTLTQEDPERLQVTLIVTEGTVDVEEPVSEETGIYPNPATDEINIRVPVGHASYDVQIVDMQGRVVYTGSAKGLNGIMLIEVGQYAPGLYHVNLRGNDKSYYGRFVKQE